ncbi:hypothetical protein HMPREF1981_03245 [Bacteroides pyogenes F0041]|uniref:Uncharacterized protein n=1 Tax=Bacteroides pyogenes F0041 TaxID=1321819 RepID=U2BT68_9BACE|nr:hypothetical protein HMPREF1981_03245 [Bacteroides pyogenes F0041]
MKAKALFCEIRGAVLRNQRYYSSKTELLSGVNRTSIRPQ